MKLSHTRIKNIGAYFGHLLEPMQEQLLMDVAGANCMTRRRRLRDRTYDNGKVFWWTLEFVHVGQGRDAPGGIGSEWT